jgi:hypothetical protein
MKIQSFEEYMITYYEYLNESKFATPDAVEKFETEGKCKALPVKYVMMFDDKEINDVLEVMYYNTDDRFVVTTKGEFFSGESWKTPSYMSALNYIKLFMISKEFRNYHIVDELKWVLTKDDANKSWNELIDKFLKRIEQTRMDLKPEEFEALGITKNTLVANKYGI